MEKPYSGRAKISETMRSISIELRPKRHWFAIVFATFWLVGWTIGELLALKRVFNGIISGDLLNFGFLFTLICLFGWNYFGFFMIRSWLWLTIGSDIISFDRSKLKIRRKGILFHSPKSYDLQEVKNFAINQHYVNDIFSSNSNKNIFRLSSNGIFKFDYGLKTIKIGQGIDEAEGRFIIKKVVTKGFLKK